MKNIVFLLLMTTIILACKNEIKTKKTTQETQETQNMVYASFGNQIVAQGAITEAEMAERYKSLKVGDTLTTKLSAKINEVCSNKGCWMKLDLGNNEEVRVTFKDYAFFMPLNAEGEVVVNGKAFIKETSIENLRHFAKDAGKSTEEILAISQPEKTFAFEADGVLLKQ
jgi:hypothetical protein